ncbi:inositol monophosphatase [Streptomyces vinaceusdrappus]|uniref:Inositol-1-monophosphatase n=1 Tax=Streptomyces vinaceusdrappus TaxID=67376 RepID=A0ABY6C2V3_9ACTN|nr:inositol monophosphatase family protein [Streptomyces vinaceusdrappus]UXI81796.1 inositol monophosphatase [Streptomyces vinaceusdrappus]
MSLAELEQRPLLTRQELQDCLAAAQQAARSGGDELLRSFRAVTDVRYKQAHTDPVSGADLASEAAITGWLRRHRPDDGVLAEEGSDEAGKSGLRWVVDPLDGTVNYLRGHTFWGVSVACEQWRGGRWDPVVGVVFDPLHDEVFSAMEGQGAFLGEERLSGPLTGHLDDALIATGYAYDVSHRREQGVRLAGLVGGVAGVRMLGSTALALSWVAAGRLDAYFEDRASRWDWAAGRLIAREAGARVRPLGTGVLAAADVLFEGIEEHVVTADTVEAQGNSSW